MRRWMLAESIVVIIYMCVCVCVCVYVCVYIYISQPIVLCTLNLYNEICQ